MAKLRLTLDELQVETFPTTGGAAGRGTVRGQDSGTDDLYCQAGTWGGNGCDSTQYQIMCGCTAGGPENGTCDVSCGATCMMDETCDYGCGATYDAHCPTNPGYQGCY